MISFQLQYCHGQLPCKSSAFPPLMMASRPSARLGADPLCPAILAAWHWRLSRRRTLKPPGWRRRRRAVAVRPAVIVAGGTAWVNGALVIASCNQRPKSSPSTGRHKKP